MSRPKGAPRCVKWEREACIQPPGTPPGSGQTCTAISGGFLRFPLNWRPGPPDMPVHCGSLGLGCGEGGARQLDLLPSTQPCAAASPDSARLCCECCLCSFLAHGGWQLLLPAPWLCDVAGAFTSVLLPEVMPFALTIKPQVPGASPQFSGFPLLPAVSHLSGPPDALPNKHQHAVLCSRQQGSAVLSEAPQLLSQAGSRCF